MNHRRLDLLRVRLRRVLPLVRPHRVPLRERLLRVLLLERRLLLRKCNPSPISCRTLEAICLRDSCFQVVIASRKSSDAVAWVPCTRFVMSIQAKFAR